MALELSRRLKPLGCALRNDSPISQNWASKGAAASSMIRELLAPESYCQSQKVVTASNRHNQETVTIRKLTAIAAGSTSKPCLLRSTPTKQIPCPGSWHLQSSWLAPGTWPAHTAWSCLPAESTEHRMQALLYFYVPNLVEFMWLAEYKLLISNHWSLWFLLEMWYYLWFAVVERSGGSGSFLLAFLPGNSHHSTGQEAKWGFF